MEGLLKNKKLAVYILTVLVVLQVIFLFAQLLILRNWPGLPKSSVSDGSPILPFLFFFVFIPSILLSKKNNLSEKKKALLTWGLVILAAIVLSLMLGCIGKSLVK